MWRSQTLRKGRQIVTFTQRHLAAEAGGASSTPPSPQPKSSFGLVKFFGLGLPAATGGIVGYAWYDTDFRKQLEDNVPYSKELLEYVLPIDGPTNVSRDPSKQVEKSQIPKPIFDSQPTSNTESSVFPASLMPSASCSTEEELLHKVNDDVEVNNKNEQNVKDSNQNNRRSDIQEDKKLIDDKDKNKGVHYSDLQRIQELLPDKKTVEVSTKLSDLAMEKQVNKKDSKNDPITLAQKVRNKEIEEKEENAALEVVIDKLLESGQNWVQEAARAQLDVAKATKNHSALLKKAMDETSNILDKDAEWEAVTIAYQERDIAAARAVELIDEAKKRIEKLKKVLDDAKSNKVTMKNSSIYPATKKLSELTKEMSTAGAQVRQAAADAKVMLKYKDLVDKGRKQFQLELESLLPDAKSGGKSRKLTEEELNALIAHAHRRIEQLQKQIAEHLVMERSRLSAALDSQKEENKGLIEAAVKDERTHLITEFELEKQKLEVEFAAWMEADVRKQLSRQAAAHSDHLKDVLAVQEQEMSKDFERKINIKLLEEREKFQSETAGWISRLKGIEAAVDARAASEKLAHTAQDLWLACIALNSTIQFGDEQSNSLTPLKSHVATVLNTADKHPFVQTVAKTIPQAALDRGIYTENDLRDRFIRVSQVSRRLGLVPESNASLYKYLVSFLHSFFTVGNVAAYSEKDMVPLNQMDNFKLVANAQYWMEKGNLDMAVRFMNQLTGESKNAAADWIAEAKLLLETRQAAQTILTFASATGLAATF